MSSRGDYGSGTPGARPYSSTVGSNLASGGDVVLGSTSDVAAPRPLFVVSSVAPANGDQWPDGTIYIQTV